MKRLSVALLFGGKSGEHEVSLRSAASILQALDRNRYHVIPVGITKRGEWRAGPAFSETDFPGTLEQGGSVFLPPHLGGQAKLHLLSGTASSQADVKLDLVFPALHGTFGEDGTLQGMLEMANIPYVGAGVLGSAAAMDKEVTKRLLRDAGLPIVDFVTTLDFQWKDDPKAVAGRIESTLGYPCFVKPANLGSSVGISKARNLEELHRAMDLAVQFDRKVVIEKGINAREIECSVLGNDQPLASLPGEIVPSNEFYDYQAKYLDEGSRLLIPAPLQPSQVQIIQDLAVKTFVATECAGMARVDFFIDKETSEISINEINTIPGFTSISMYPKLWEATGISYSVLLDRLIELALDRHRARQSKITSYQP
ncbi:MAG: D-alanine--D-alanine ligase family protein [Terriglobia bacterium]